MVNILDHINLIAGLTVLWIVFTIIYWIYNNIFNPIIRIIDVDQDHKVVLVRFTKNFNHVTVRLTPMAEMIEFEGDRYYWAPNIDSPNEAYFLSVEKAGRSKEILSIDFTNQNVYQHAI